VKALKWHAEGILKAWEWHGNMEENATSAVPKEGGFWAIGTGWMIGTGFGGVRCFCDMKTMVN
jgi:hypothetical protein